MHSNWIALAAAACLWAAPAGATSPTLASGAEAWGRALAPGDWIVEAKDNVCGLKDARQLRNPAVVTYTTLIDATAEMKEMKRRGIDKDSPEGQVLYTKAVDRVRSASSKVMRDQGHDSVWKAIRHRKGERATDLTDAIKTVVERPSGQAGGRN